MFLPSYAACIIGQGTESEELAMRVMMAGATGMVGLAMLNAARRGSGRLVLESGDTCALGAGKVIGLQLLMRPNEV
jgi:hypothetical protein